MIQASSRPNKNSSSIIQKYYQYPCIHHIIPSQIIKYDRDLVTPEMLWCVCDGILVHICLLCLHITLIDFSIGIIVRQYISR